MTEDIRELAAETGLEALEGLEANAGGAPLHLVARVSPRSSAREGDRLTLAVDTGELHFFDPETGASITE